MTSKSVPRRREIDDEDEAFLTWLGVSFEPFRFGLKMALFGERVQGIRCVDALGLL